MLSIFYVYVIPDTFLFTFRLQRLPRNQAVEIAHPNATYELVIKVLLGKKSPIPRGRISLPHAPKPAKADRILVFAEGRAAENAKRAGADIVGGTELIDGILSGRHQANLILSTPDLVKAIAPKLGRVLGPRGMMPTERRGTVMADPANFIMKLKGSSEWKSDKGGAIRSPIGKVSGFVSVLYFVVCVNLLTSKVNFPVEKVVQNVRHFIDVVKKGIKRGEQAEKGGQQRERDLVFCHVHSRSQTLPDHSHHH